MLVELMGPSGVGKSTILKAFYEKNEKSGGPQEPKNSASCGLAHEDLRFFCDFFELDKFLDGVISILSSANMPPTKKMSAIKMVNDTALVFAQQSLMQQVDSFVVDIKDEFFLHRSYAVLLYSSNFLEDAEWYFENVPTPDAAVIFTASVATILERIKQRGKLVNSYLYLSDREVLFMVNRSLEMYDMACDILRKRGVRVFYLDADYDLKGSVRSMSDIIKKLEGDNG